MPGKHLLIKFVFRTETSSLSKASLFKLEGLSQLDEFRSSSQLDLHCLERGRVLQEMYLRSEGTGLHKSAVQLESLCFQ